METPSGIVPTDALRAMVPVVLVMGPLTAFAGREDILEAGQESEFSFGRSLSEVPFYAVGWAQEHFCPRVWLKDEGGVRPENGSTSKFGW